MDPFSIALLIFSAGSGVASMVSANTANKRNRRAQAEQRDMSNLRAAKERREQIRNQRLAFATAENNAALGGVSDSSGAQGGQGSIITQGNANLAFLDRQQAHANAAANWLDSAAKAESSANMWGGFSKLAMSGFDFLGSLKSPAAITPPPQEVNMGSGFGDMLKRYQDNRNTAAMPAYARTGGM